LEIGDWRLIDESTSISNHDSPINKESQIKDHQSFDDFEGQ
jgi:hypothetical protein